MDYTKLGELLGERNSAQHALDEERRRLHTEFVSQHRVTLKLTDISFVFLILCMVGARVTTNFMVAKETPNITYVEVSPVTAAQDNLVMHPDREVRLEWIRTVLLGLFVYSILIYTYIHFRSYIHYWRQYICLITIVFTLVCICGADLLMDLGYLFGGWFA